MTDFVRLRAEPGRAHGPSNFTTNSIRVISIEERDGRVCAYITSIPAYRLCAALFIHLWHAELC